MRRVLGYRYWEMMCESSSEGVAGGRTIQREAIVIDVAGAHQPSAGDKGQEGTREHRETVDVMI